MKKQLLSACLAAVAFQTAGCTDEPKSNPEPRVEIRIQPRVDKPPVKVASSTSASSTTSSVFDAGVTTSEPPKVEEVLALSHEDGREIDHLARAVSLREQGDLDGALAEARRAHFDHPEDVDVLTQIDRITKLSGERDLRVVALERIAALRPEDAMPLIQQARVLIAMKKPNDAIRVASEAMKRDVNNPEVYQAMGRAHLNQGQLAQAITQFKNVLTLEPDHGYALNNLGFAYLRSNQNEDAVEVLTRASELLPHIAYVWNNLGVALERTGNVEEAKLAYSESSFLSPKYVKAQVNAARVAVLRQNAMADTDVEVEMEPETDMQPDSEDVVPLEPVMEE